jgi:hypothetical protein
MISFRKAIAAMFFAVLAFVYAEKIFHKHECSIIETNQTSVTLNFEYSICTLCDFQPVSAADVPFIAECTVPVKFVFQRFTLPKDNYCYKSVELIQGRGPPKAC